MATHAVSSMQYPRMDVPDCICGLAAPEVALLPGEQSSVCQAGRFPAHDHAWFTAGCLVLPLSGPTCEVVVRRAHPYLLCSAPPRFEVWPLDSHWVQDQLRQGNVWLLTKPREEGASSSGSSSSSACGGARSPGSPLHNANGNAGSEQQQQQEGQAWQEAGGEGGSGRGCGDGHEEVLGVMLLAYFKFKDRWSAGGGDEPGAGAARCTCSTTHSCLSSKHVREASRWVTQHGRTVVSCGTTAGSSVALYALHDFSVQLLTAVSLR